jgi:hypothetical protein
MMTKMKAMIDLKSKSLPNNCTNISNKGIECLIGITGGAMKLGHHMEKAKIGMRNAEKMALFLSTDNIVGLKM